MYCNLVALMLFEIVKNCVFVFLETAGFYILSFHQLSLIKQTFKSYKSKLELTSSFRYLALNLDHLDNTYINVRTWRETNLQSQNNVLFLPNYFWLVNFKIDFITKNFEKWLTSETSHKNQANPEDFPWISQSLAPEVK